MVGRGSIKKPRTSRAVPRPTGARRGRPAKQVRGRVEGVPTRERIVAVAERLFDQRGFQATNLSDIAGEAGIRAPSLLHYFDSKEHLLDEVIRRAHAEIREKVVLALASGGSGTERISGVVREVRQLWEGRPGLVRIALAEALRPDGVGRSYLAQAAQLFELVEKVFRESTDPPIPPQVPVRGALLMIFSSELFRLAVGEIGDALWGSDRDRTEQVHLALLKALRANGRKT
jgi:AcrR family transcriptional regulator